MKALVAGIFLILLVETQCRPMDWLEDMRFAGEALLGAREMLHAYTDMIEANHKNSDKYFHARGNYDAAQWGDGGRWAARVISDARESIQVGMPSGRGAADTEADQEANIHGRYGGDPNVYRPPQLPHKY